MSGAIWNKPWFKAWSRGGKILWFYLTTTNDNTCAGVYQMDPDVAKMKTGPWRQQEWDQALAALHPHIVFYPGQWLWVTGYLEHNSHGINEKIGKGVVAVVAEAPEQLRADFYALYGGTLKGIGVSYDTPSIPPRYPFDETSPPLPSPPLPTPNDIGASGKPSRPRSKPRKLTDEQNGVKQGAINYWRQRQIDHVGIPNPRWKSKGKNNGGVAAGFFTERILEPDNEFTLDDLKGITDVFFDDWTKDESAVNFDHFIAAWNGLCKKWRKKLEEGAADENKPAV